MSICLLMQIMADNCSSILILLWMILSKAEASHFRGGTASWKHVRSINNLHEIELNFRFGWRRDFFNPICDEQIIENRILGYDGGSWTLVNGQSSQFPVSVAVKCTTFDSSENWAYGFNNVALNITASSFFTIKFTGSNWISGLVSGGGSSWSVALIDIDLRTRSDTGFANNPPRALSAPVLRLQQGCPEVIKINVLDDDNDNLFCRLGRTTEECEGICGSRLHFTLDSHACTISYDGGGVTTSLVPFALMIEDRPRQAITVGGSQLFTTSDSLSQVPLQFLVQISTTTGCNVVPTYPSYSIPDNTTFTIPNKGVINETLYAYPSDPSYDIVQFIILGPLGVRSSAIYEFRPNVFATDITWQPGPSQAGDHIICYYAVDQVGKNGKQLCFRVTVAPISNPCDVDNGGCNDVCVATGTTSACSCSRPCWNLAPDKKTCIPLMDVSCTGGSIDVSMDACATNKSIVAGSSASSFNQTQCQSVLQNSAHVLSFTPQDCNLRVQANPVEVQYAINVWTWEGEYFQSGQSVITRGQYQNIPVTCSLPSTLNITGSFVPALPLNNDFVPEIVTIEGLGEFSLYFEFYRESTFSSSYGPADFPLRISVNDDLYFSLGAVGRAGLVFFTQKCSALSSSTITPTTLQYTFIEEGCLVDNTTEKYATSNLMENRFSVKAFEFENRLLASRQTADIFLRCDVMLCDENGNNTRCSQACLSGTLRGKRSVRRFEEYENPSSKKVVGRKDDEDHFLPPPEIPQSPPQELSTRFILVVDPEDDDSKSGNEANYINWILLGIGLALLLVVIFFAYRLLDRRRKRNTHKQRENVCVPPENEKISYSQNVEI